MRVAQGEDVRVLILLPVLNEASLIARCIESVRSQSHANWLLVCQDNNSEDSTFSQVKSISDEDDRVIIEKLTSQVSVSENWESLARKSLILYESDFVCWLAGDDFWSKTDYLTKLIGAMQSTNAGIASPCFQIVSPEEKVVQNSFCVNLEGSTKLQRIWSLLRDWSGTYVIYSLYRRREFEKIFFQGGALSEYSGSDWWWSYFAILDCEVINVSNVDFYKTLWPRERRKSFSERTKNTGLIDQVIDILRRGFINWKDQANLFRDHIIRERARMKIINDWTLIIVVPYFLAKTIYQTLRFPITQMSLKYKAIKRERVLN